MAKLIDTGTISFKYVSDKETQTEIPKIMVGFDLLFS